MCGPCALLFCLSSSETVGVCTNCWANLPTRDSQRKQHAAPAVVSLAPGVHGHRAGFAILARKCNMNKGGNAVTEEETIALTSSQGFIVSSVASYTLGEHRGRETDETSQRSARWKGLDGARVEPGQSWGRPAVLASSIPAIPCERRYQRACLSHACPFALTPVWMPAPYQRPCLDIQLV